MILEVATLNIKKGLSADFETNFKKAEKIISSMKGYISHQFRQSDEYQEWKALLHHFYKPFPEVEHYK